MMAWLDAVPVLVRVLISLALILGLSRCFRELCWSLALGALALALLSGHGPGTAVAIVVGRLASWDSLMLALIVWQVIWLSRQMAEAGLLRELVEAIRPRVSQRTAMAVLPAVIGLLPMPGGALFSAPLVDECDPERQLCSLLKARVNYWFRHVWEFWWPLYPGVLLAAALSGLELWQFILLQLPVTVLAVAVGQVALLRQLPAATTAGSAAAGAPLPAVCPWPWRTLLPIVLTIVVYAVVRLFWPRLAEMNQYLPMALGIAAATVLIQCWRPFTMAAWARIILSRQALWMVLAVLAVRVYGAFIEARLPGGTLLVEQMRGELQAAGIPMVAVMIALPFLCGMTTGLSIGFVGASFPVVMNLVAPGAGFGTVAAAAVLAYGSGFYGMILSPVHICLVVTNQHFRTDLLHSLRRLAAPALVTIALIGAYAWLLHAWLR